MRAASSRCRSCRAQPARVTIMFKEFGVQAEFQADDCGRRDPPEGAAGGQLARLQQRHHARGIPHSGADHAPRRDGSGAARRPVVRDRRAARATSRRTTAAAIPFLSQIPIIGNLFKSNADRKERTELMVLVTPRLVRPLNPDEVPPLPTMPGRFLPQRRRHWRAAQKAAGGTGETRQAGQQST